MNMTTNKNAFDISNPSPNSSYISQLVAEMEESPKFIIVGGRPTIGKTHFALDLLHETTVVSGKSSIFFSLESTSQEIINGLIARESKVPLDKIIREKLSAQEAVQVEKAKEVIGETNLLVCAASEPSLDAIREVCLSQIDTPGGIGTIYIDYLQLMSVSKGVSANRQEAIAQISRGLKLLTRELGVSIVLFSQLSREVEKREDKTPRLSDFRESSALEQDADIVIGLHRPEHYNPTDSPGELFAIVAKHRAGATGTYRVKAA